MREIEDGKDLLIQLSKLIKQYFHLCAALVSDTGICRGGLGVLGLDGVMILILRDFFAVRHSAIKP